MPLPLALFLDATDDAAVSTGTSGGASVGASDGASTVISENVAVDCGSIISMNTGRSEMVAASSGDSRADVSTLNFVAKRSMKSASAVASAAGIAKKRASSAQVDTPLISGGRAK